MGRFQPFHHGHQHAVEYALGMTARLLVGIGSSNRSGEPDNPFTATERRTMIMNSLDQKIRNRVNIYEIPDVQNHIRWMSIIRETLPEFDVIFTNDSLTARLYRREGIQVVPIPFLDRQSLSGTTIRESISSGLPWEERVPSGTSQVVRRMVSGGEWPATRL